MELIHVIIQGVLLGGLYALFAAGLSLIFGVMRLVNIAHGDLIVVAAYMAYFTMQALGIGPFTSLIVVVPAIAIFGYALQRGLLNFALGDDLPPLLVTFGLSVIIQNVLLILFTHDSRRLYAGPIEMASWKFTPDLAVGVLPVIQFVVAVAVIGGLQLLFYRTTLGREMTVPRIGPSTLPMPPMTVMKIIFTVQSLMLKAENGVMLSFCRNTVEPTMAVAAAATTNTTIRARLTSMPFDFAAVSLSRIACKARP
jgi:branched-chain amino acid transport system permease protein